MLPRSGLIVAGILAVWALGTWHLASSLKETKKSLAEKTEKVAQLEDSLKKVQVYNSSLELLRDHHYAVLRKFDLHIQELRHRVAAGTSSVYVNAECPPTPSIPSDAPRTEPTYPRFGSLVGQEYLDWRKQLRGVVEMLRFCVAERQELHRMYFKPVNP